MVTACGSSNARSVCKILSSCLPNSRIIGTDSSDVREITPIDNVTSIHQVPFGNDPQFTSILLNLAINNQVNLIIPIHDLELEQLARASYEFRKHHIEIGLPKPEAVQTCNDKYKFYEFCQKFRLPAIPTSLTPEMDFPIFVKPRFGNGSQNCFTAYKKSDLQFIGRYVEQPIYQPKKEGQKIVIDFVANQDGELECALSREELKSIDGNGTRVIINDRPRLIELTAKITKCLHFHGLGNLEVFINGDEAQIIELNPRASSGIIFTYLAGLDILSHFICSYGFSSVKPKTNPIKYNQRMHREWHEYIIN